MIARALLFSLLLAAASKQAVLFLLLRPILSAVDGKLSMMLGICRTIPWSLSYPKLQSYFDVENSQVGARIEYDEHVQKEVNTRDRKKNGVLVSKPANVTTGPL
ncbi:hypothetical protein BDZ91DRAFT_720874 [Kalaharituber pfeilii]|nr:hypothetical protein BDZ91DRAFT_720874 [Kalaharituber pfeilii]